jgi:hypothetical protein
VELAKGHEWAETAKKLSGCIEWIVCNGYNLDSGAFTEEVDAESTARKTLQNYLRPKLSCGNFLSPGTSGLTRATGTLFRK